MQSHRAWIKKAENDLHGAKVLFQEKINDLSVYHSHQCAEKALKSFLASQLFPIQKSHDLVVLTEQCLRNDPSFESLRTNVEALNIFGTLTRYPSDRDDPDGETTQRAINDAEKILVFVKSKLEFM